MIYESEQYFRGVQNDLRGLGVVNKPKVPIKDIHDLVSEFRYAAVCQGSIGETDFEPVKALGKLLKSWAPMTFNPSKRRIGLCSEAEPDFISNANGAMGPALPSPLIIVNGSKPVALAKASGVSTIYSFTHLPEYGLYPGIISYNNGLFNRPGDLPRRNGAYLLDLAEIGVPFEPLRPSALLVPRRFRRELPDSEDFWSSRGLSLGYRSGKLFGECVELVANGSGLPVHMGESGELMPEVGEREQRVSV